MRRKSLRILTILSLSAALATPALAGGDGGDSPTPPEETVIRDIIGWDREDWEKFKRWKQRRHREREQYRRDWKEHRESDMYRDFNPVSWLSQFDAQMSNLGY